MSEFRRAVWSRALTDAKAVDTHVHLIWGVGVAVITAVVDYWREQEWQHPLAYGLLALFLWIVCVFAYFYARAPSVVRHTDGTLFRLRRARFTFSRMSEALAVQMYGLGSELCCSMAPRIAVSS